MIFPDVRIAFSFFWTWVFTTFCQSGLWLQFIYISKSQQVGRTFALLSVEASLIVKQLLLAKWSEPALFRQGESGANQFRARIIMSRFQMIRSLALIDASMIIAWRSYYTSYFLIKCKQAVSLRNTVDLPWRPHLSHVDIYSEILTIILY